MKPVTEDTFLEYRFPNRLAYNPSGNMIAFILTEPDFSTNSYVHRLTVSRNNQFTQAFVLDGRSCFIWENEETIIFTGDFANGYTAIYRGNVLTGKQTKITAYRLNIKEIARLECGMYIAICRTDANCPDYWRMSEEERTRMDNLYASECDYEIMEELPYCKNGESRFVNRQRDSIFLLNFETGDCRRITEPYFQTETYCIDGNTIYFSGTSYNKKMSVFHDIWSCILPKGTMRCLHYGNTYNIRGLVMWNKRLMVAGNTNPNIKLFHSEFYEMDKTNGEIRSFCRYEYSIRSYVLSDCTFGKPRLFQCDGDRLYFISTIRNASWLMALEENGEVTPVIKKEGAVCDFDVKSRNIYFTALYGQKLIECYCSDNSGNFYQISSFNQRVLADKYVAVPQKHIFLFDGVDIDGWALEPYGYEKNKKYPAILDIHGGPNACYSEAFFHEMQVWAGRGFYVIFCNPVGSEGRKDEFMNIHGHFGEKDYECLMKFTDEMIAKYPQIDSDRLCVTGGSYGGFMTNWIITHTDRFAAAVSQRGIANWITTELLCDNGWYNMPPQLMGSVLTDAGQLWRQSPLKYINNVKTPTLFLHAEEDFSVPDEEGMQMFSALMAIGVETKMIRFKGENHELSRSGRPLQRIRRLTEIIYWLECHI